MSPSAFKQWRKQLGLSQKEAAEALGLKRRVVQYYEKGERDGEAVSIPKAVRLACWALLQGVTDFKGLDKGAGKVEGKDAPKEAKKDKPGRPDLDGSAVEEKDRENADQAGRTGT